MRRTTRLCRVRNRLWWWRTNRWEEHFVIMKLLAWFILCSNRDFENANMYDREQENGDWKSRPMADFEHTVYIRWVRLSAQLLSSSCKPSNQQSHRCVLFLSSDSHTAPKVNVWSKYANLEVKNRKEDVCLWCWNTVTEGFRGLICIQGCTGRMERLSLLFWCDLWFPWVASDFN